MCSVLVWCVSLLLGCFSSVTGLKPSPDEKTAAMVFLHGLGDAGDGWRQNFRAAVKASGLDFGHVSWLFPKAPRQAVTLNGGAHMPSWYDVKGLDPSAEEDRIGYAASAQLVEAAVAKLMKSYPSLRRDRIVVGGFSQGAVIALSFLLQTRSQVAGIVALSGYLPERGVLEDRLNETNLNYSRRAVPVLMCHGTQDELVAFKWGKASAKLIKGSGMNIQWKTFPIAHTASDEELVHVVQFLNRVIPPRLGAQLDEL